MGDVEVALFIAYHCFRKDKDPTYSLQLMAACAYMCSCFGESVVQRPDLGPVVAALVGASTVLSYLTHALVEASFLTASMGSRPRILLVGTAAALAQFVGRVPDFSSWGEAAPKILHLFALAADYIHDAYMTVGSPMGAVTLNEGLAESAQVQVFAMLAYGLKDLRPVPKAIRCNNPAYQLQHLYYTKRMQLLERMLAVCIHGRNRAARLWPLLYADLLGIHKGEGV